MFPANKPVFLAMPTRQSSKPAPTLRLKNILPAIGSLTRWRMLAELAKGEPLPATELARRGRLSLNAASKHLVLLYEAGLVDRGYGRLYRIPQQFFVAGVCGGYTTFSSFSLQTLNLAREGQWLGAAANIVLSVLLCLGAVWLGHLAGQLFNR